jgi:hypothetical protein
MVLTPFSRVLLCLLISLLVLWLGLVVLRETISTWSLVVWVGVAFSLLRTVRGLQIQTLIVSA